MAKADWNDLLHWLDQVEAGACEMDPALENLMGCSDASEPQQQEKGMQVVALSDETDPGGVFENAALDLADVSPVRLAEHETSIIVYLSPDEDVVGAIYYGRRERQEGWPEVTFTVIVDDDHRRQGIGTELVSELAYLQQFKGLGDDCPELRAWIVNPSMRRLLERLGFDEDGRDHMVRRS